ncbi:hypothetical protein YB2330_003855 [Saitoella coloradoensis]
MPREILSPAAECTASPVKPQPRPRPRPRAKAPLPADGKNADEDDFFFRRNTYKHVLEAQKKTEEVKKRKLSPHENSSRDVTKSPERGQYTVDFPVASDSSSDSEDDEPEPTARVIPILRSSQSAGPRSTDASRRPPAKATPAKQKERPRRRSLSLTPPPALPVDVIKIGTRRILAEFVDKDTSPAPEPKQQPSSDTPMRRMRNQKPTMLDEWVDKKPESPPRTRTRTRRQSTVYSSASTGLPAPNPTLEDIEPTIINDTPLPSIQKSEIPHVELALLGHTSPHDPIALPPSWPVPIVFRLRLNQPFRSLLKAYLARKNMLDEEVGKNIVMAWKGIRVFGAGTPMGVGMRGGDRGVLEVWTGEGFVGKKREEERERERKGKEEEDAKDLENGDRDDIGTPDVNFLAERSASVSAQAPNQQQYLKILLRGKDGDLKLKVKPTDTGAKLAKFYRAQKKISEGVKVTLVIDGDDVGNEEEVGDMDVEDGDMIEVRVG